MTKFSSLAAQGIAKMCLTTSNHLLSGFSGVDALVCLYVSTQIFRTLKVLIWAPFRSKSLVGGNLIRNFLWFELRRKFRKLDAGNQWQLGGKELIQMYTIAKQCKSMMCKVKSSHNHHTHTTASSNWCRRYKYTLNGSCLCFYLSFGYGFVFISHTHSSGNMLSFDCYYWRMCWKQINWKICGKIHNGKVWIHSWGCST